MACTTAWRTSSCRGERFSSRIVPLKMDTAPWLTTSTIGDHLIVVLPGFADVVGGEEVGRARYGLWSVAGLGQALAIGR